MLPNYYECTSCRERLYFKFHDACYYVGSSLVDQRVAAQDLLSIPARPVWCKHCDGIGLVENIASLRTFETAYGTVRRGQPVEYPTATECMDTTEAERVVGAYLHWRMQRRHAPRALCCGGENYQLMDVAMPLLKHAECDFGVIEPVFLISPYCGPGPGVIASAEIPLYDTEGTLIGRLTWRNQTDHTWAVVAAHYTTEADAP